MAYNIDYNKEITAGYLDADGRPLPGVLLIPGVGFRHFYELAIIDDSMLDKVRTFPKQSKIAALWLMFNLAERDSVISEAIGQELTSTIGQDAKSALFQIAGFCASGGHTDRDILAETLLRILHIHEEDEARYTA